MERMVELAREAKQLLGDRASDIIAQGMGRVVARGKILCLRHAEKNPSMSWSKDKHKWHCFSCGQSYDIYDYFIEGKGLKFSEAVNEVRQLVGLNNVDARNRAPETTEFAVPRIDKRPLGEEALAYMAERKISKETLEHWKVRERTWNGRDVFVFPYFDIDDSLVYVSYRDIAKGGNKGGCEKGTKAILWGLDRINPESPLVITEGQLDAMSVWQAGYKNVVSMPSGANNMNWIEYHFDLLNSVSDLVVFADNDTAGMGAARQIKARLPHVRIANSDIHKDANEMLMSGKEDLILKVINDALEKTPAGVIDIARVEYIPKSARVKSGIESGFRDMDAELRDLKLGEMSLILGRNNEGKSTFVSQMIAHSIHREVPVFLFSGEMSIQKTQDWLYSQIICGRPEYMDEFKSKYGVERDVSPHVVRAIKKWHEGKFFMFDMEQHDGKNHEKLFKAIDGCVRRNGVKLVVLDNLMTVLEENASTIYSDQGNFVQRCKNFAIAHDIHIALVAHPNKVKQEIQPDKKDPDKVEGNLEKTDISGSNNIANKMDNIIAVERIWSDPRPCDALITCLKNREDGQRFVAKYNYSLSSRRFWNKRTPEFWEYGWKEYMEDVRPSLDCYTEEF